MEVSDEYDIVIIGSGLGGLACGSILCQLGYKVCVLEQHFQIGGCLQDFKRKGRLFDTGMHYIGSYDDGEILNTLFRYFKIYDKVDVQKMDKEGFDILRMNDLEFKIPQGVDNFQAKLIAHFPDEKKAIEAYFEKILSIYNSVDILNLRDINNFELSLKDGIDENVYDFVCRLTENKELQHILCYGNSLYAGKKESASLFVHSIISVFYLQSAWKLIHGGGQIAKALADVIVDNGGKVVTGARVKKLLCSGNRVCEAEISEQFSVRGKRFISNIDPLSTMKLLDGVGIRKAFLNRLERLEQTVSCFSLYIILKEKTVPYQCANVYYYNQDDVWGLDSYSEESWPQGFMLYSNESTKHKGYSDTLIVLSPMEFNEMKPWFDTSIGKRGENYEKMKLKKASDLLDLMEKSLPGIRENIDTMYTSTPLTYRDYTGVTKGAMYGVLTDCRYPYESQISPKTRLDNLFLTGQNINMHGVLGVSMGAILTCGQMEGINNIISAIRTYKKETGC